MQTDISRIAEQLKAFAKSYISQFWLGVDDRNSQAPDSILTGVSFDLFWNLTSCIPMLSGEKNSVESSAKHHISQFWLPVDYKNPQTSPIVP